MRRMPFLFLNFVLAYVGFIAKAQGLQPRPTLADVKASVEKEILQFLDSYAVDLRRHSVDAIAARYDSDGVLYLRRGIKALVSFDDMKRAYSKDWPGPTSFEWKDIAVEVLSAEAAVVAGRFEWVDAGGAKTVPYTGLYVKRSGQWRIRLEHESWPPPKPPK